MGSSPLSGAKLVPYVRKMALSDPKPTSEKSTGHSGLIGFLSVIKPIGPSSMQAVSVVRRRAGSVRTGHAGTLDPLASGVLVMGLGKATRLLQEVMATDKTYRTTIDLSAFTNTDDREGEMQPVSISKPPTQETVAAALKSFEGEVMQRPPQFSAVKIDGVRAYKKARKNQVVKIEPRRVFVHELRLLSYAWPEVELEVRCRTGFYVRSLARDLGVALGTGGHCAAIVRTAVGPFTEALSVPLEAVPDPVTSEDLVSVKQWESFLAG